MLKIGIAGFGKIGQIRANEIFKNENTILKAVFDINKPSNLDNNIAFCTSFENLNSMPSICLTVYPHPTTIKNM